MVGRKRASSRPAACSRWPWRGSAQAPITEQDLKSLACRRELTGWRRVAQFLASRDLLIALPRVDHHQQAVERMLTEFHLGINAELRQWVAVLRGQGRHRHRPLPLATIRRYLTYLRPVLADWSQRHESLREITSEEARQAIRVVQGSSAGDRHVALRSLFTALKQQRLIFRNPMTGIRLTGHGNPPRALGSDRIGRLLTATHDTATKLITVLAAVHALTVTQIRHAHIYDLDLAAGRLNLRSWARPMVILDELTLTVAAAWLGDRARRWPKSANRRLLISSQTAADTEHRPITTVHVHQLLQRLGVSATQLRMDRILHEARVTADPVHLVRLFGISITTAMNYLHTAHPDRIAMRR